MIREFRIEQFRLVYKEQLQLATETYPDDYPWAHKATVIHGFAGMVAI